MADCEHCDALRAEVERLREGVAVAGRLFVASRDALAEVNAENEKLRAALEPLACTCDRPNGAACSRSEVNCSFWNARAALEEK